MKQLAHLLSKNTHRVIGLMSGTSADGVDAALCEISGEGRGNISVRLIRLYSKDYDRVTREKILSVCKPGGGSSAEICELNFLLAEEFAHAIKNLLSEVNMTAVDVDFIGSHGQTIWHNPPHGGHDAIRRGSTLQIGDASVLVERTGIPVVSNFRPRDMAAGGQGAPLVPYVDYLLFSSDTETRAALNIGGIANVTYLPAGGKPEDTIAFDTGPGNMIIDALVRKMTNGAQDFDDGGRIAASGRVDESLLNELLAHEYFRRSPPKSTGREMFGAAFGDALWSRASANPSDLIATVTAFTAATIAGSLSSLGRVSELIAAGGGPLNTTLMSMLAERLPQTRISTTGAYGIPIKAKEAVAFAILARETMLGRPGNLPSATGASGPRVLGQITF